LQPPKAISLLGPISRQGTERVTTVRFHQDGGYLICQSAEKLVEIFKVRGQAEIEARLEKRDKKKKKQQKKAREAGEGEDEDEDEDTPGITPDLILSAVAVIRPPAKVKSVAYLPTEAGTAKGFKILVALHNNTIEVYSVDHSTKPVNVSQTSTLDLPGHRSDVRTVAVSSDDQIFLSASNSKRV